jgi:ATP-binding cassette subfamily F protein 3
MLRISDLSKSYGKQVLFKNVSFSMAKGERLGIIGRNGHGKSTLFRIILGQEEADEGEVILPKGYRIGHVDQHLHFTQPTIVAEGAMGLPPDERDQTWRVEKILFGLGFSKTDLEKSPQDFSGGFQIRLNLAKVLVSDPDLLLLDEPTNYLDIIAARWLSKFLSDWPREMIIITHDRTFMDSVTTHTMAIHRQNVKKIEGGTEKLAGQIVLEEENYEKTRVNLDKKKKHMMEFVERFGAKASKATQAQARMKQINKLSSLEKLSELDDLEFAFQEAPFRGKVLLEIEGVQFGYNPENPLMTNVSFFVEPGDRIGVIGKNGKGKSTLLRLIAGELQAQKGEVKWGHNVETGYFGQTNVDRLHKSHTIEEEIWNANPKLDRTKVRGICGTMMFSGDTAEKQIKVLSGGERARVLLGKILAQPCNMLLLDEPTHHLDMESVESMLYSLEVFSGGVVLVTHDEGLLRQVATKLVVFQRGNAFLFDGGYDEFLEKLGWEEEEDDEDWNDYSQPKKGKKLNKQKRVELQQGLAPFKRELRETEERISLIESALEKDKALLIVASENGRGDEIAKLSGSIGQKEREIEQLFRKMEELNDKIVEIESNDP